MPLSSFSKLGRSTNYALWYFVLVIFLPAITLVVGGLIYFWQHNLLLIVVVIWLAISAISYVAFIHWPAKIALQKLANPSNSATATSHSTESDSLPQKLAPKSDWSPTDIDVWDRCCLAIEETLTQQLEWQAMPELALSQLARISAEYKGDKKSAALQFTVPELLLVVSVASSRYRQLVVDYVPYIDKISVAKAHTLLSHKENLKSGYKWLNRLRRTTRLINPASAVVSELRDLITNKVFTEANLAIQHDLKRLLLQEVTQVGIDLYSGKLVASEIELAAYRSHSSIKDNERQFIPAEPLRILLIGQSSTGKSSLINALSQELQAEIGVLPVTNQISVHQLQFDDSTMVNLIDTPGIDGVDETRSQLLNEALEADLIIWLVKATQPARAPDQEVYSKLQATWTDNSARLPAPMIMALTHIDQLSPKSLWEPPFDLSGVDQKSKSIVAAANSAQMNIGLPDDMPTVPLYLGGKHDQYNVDAVAAQIMMLTDKSLNVQRNRRRLELGASAISWRDRWQQTKKLGRVLGQSVVRRL